MCCTQALVNNPVSRHVTRPTVTRMAFVSPSFATNSVGCAFFFFTVRPAIQKVNKKKQTHKRETLPPTYHQLWVCLSPREFVSEKCHRYQYPIRHKRTYGHPNCITMGEIHWNSHILSLFRALEQSRASPAIQGSVTNDALEQ